MSILRCLKHQNIIELHEVYEDENTVYLVLELLRGGELQTKIGSRKSFTEKTAAELFSKLLKALVHCEENEIIHRDIKPGNIILWYYYITMLYNFNNRIENDY